MELLIQKLEIGKESCNQIINILQALQSSSSSSSLDHDDDHQGDDMKHLKEGLDHHSKVVQTTLDHALVVLRSYGFNGGFMHANKAKTRRTDMNESPHHCCKTEDEFVDEVTKYVNPSKDKRGCYKRRRNEQEKIIVTESPMDDGHAWRKYGQKVILNASHPRNYYRCTHKIEEGCEATKQVQQISENPPKYKVIYNGIHTCKASISKSNNPTMLYDSIDVTQNSILLSFETPKQVPNYPYMFPPATPSSSGSSGMTVLSGFSIKEEGTPSEPLIGMHGYTTHCTSSTPDHLYAATPDTAMTGVTAVSDSVADVISSTTEIHSPGFSVHGMDDADNWYDDILDAPLFYLDDIF